MTPSGLLEMTDLIIDMALVTTVQLMLLLASWSIYSKQEVLSDLTFVLGGLRCNTHKARYQL